MIIMLLRHHGRQPGRRCHIRKNPVPLIKTEFLVAWVYGRLGEDVVRDVVPVSSEPVVVFLPDRRAAGAAFEEARYVDSDVVILGAEGLVVPGVSA